MSDQPIQPAVKVGDVVRVKVSGMISANLATRPYGTVMDGRIGVVAAIEERDGNTAYILKIDDLLNPVPCWHWQVEKLDV